MGVDNVPVGGKTAVSFPASPSSHATVSNAGPSTVYYKAEADVGAGDTELAKGASVTYSEGVRWFVCAPGQTARLFATFSPEATTDMATQAELNAVGASAAGKADKAEIEAKFEGDTLKAASLPSSVVTDSQKGADNGVGSLDAEGHQPVAQLPYQAVKSTPTQPLSVLSQGAQRQIASQVVLDNEGGVTNAHPGVGVFSDGTRLVTYAKDGVLYQVRYVGGEWGEPEEIQKPTGDSFGEENVRILNTGVVVVDDKTAVCIFAQTPAGASTETVWAKRTTDKGETWSEPVELAVPEGWAEVSTGGDGFYDTTTGKILVPVYRTWEIALIESADEGESWQDTGVRLEPPEGQKYSEACIGELTDGRLLMHIREYAQDLLLASYSSDNGATWTAPIQTVFAGLPNSRPSFVQAPDGDLLMIQRRGTAVEADSGIGVWASSSDSGITYGPRHRLPATPEYTFTNPAAAGFAYGTPVVLSDEAGVDGNVGAVYCPANSGEGGLFWVEFTAPTLNGPTYGAEVIRVENQKIPSGGFHAIEWAELEKDQIGFIWNNDTIAEPLPTRLYAPVTGTYQFTAYGGFQANANGNYRIIAFKFSSGGTRAFSEGRINGVSGALMNTSFEFHMKAGTYVELVVEQDAPEVELNFGAGAAGDRAMMTMRLAKADSEDVG